MVFTSNLQSTRDKNGIKENFQIKEWDILWYIYINKLYNKETIIEYFLYFYNKLFD